MTTEFNPLNDRNIQFDLYLMDIQKIWDEIISNQKLHEKKEPKEYEKHIKYYESLFFKMEELYTLLFDIEKSIHNLPFEYYSTYFGPFKEPNSKRKGFYEKTIRGKEAKNRITFRFDSFLSQYISLIDLIIKHCWEILREKDTTLKEKKRISLGSILASLRKKEIDENNILIKNIKKYKKEFNEIKNYRNCVIHYSSIKMDDGSKRTETGHTQTNIWIPKIERKPNDEYYLYEKNRKSLSYYSRIWFKLQLEFIRDCNFLILNK